MTDVLFNEMVREERLARAALCRLAEPGDARLTGLVEDLGAGAVLEHLCGQHDGTGDDAALRLDELDPAADLRRAERRGIRFVIPSDDEWPSQLDDLAHCEASGQRGGPPLGLWVRGPVRLDQVARSVAVVGSRSATSYGLDVAREIGGEVASHGYAVVSGAAFGIDQAAHRGALAAEGTTIAVLACGVDRAYPAAHRRLLDHLGEHGAVLSELPPGCSPTRVRFLVRNRLIAALARGTVVVEAAVRSGALNTANWTTRLSHPLMAVPGPVTSAASEGAHQLIRSGAAGLVTRGSEVLEQVGASGEHLVTEPRGPERPRDQLSAIDAQVLDAVPVAHAAGTDSIARTAGCGLTQARGALTRLERQDLVRRSDSGWKLTGRARQ